MATEHKTPLTSLEIGILWAQYVHDAMSLCVEKYYAAKERDEAARAIFRDAVALMEKNIAAVGGMLQNEGLPLPQGFTDADVNVAAPELFTDIYRLRYVKFKINLRMGANGLYLAQSSRADVRNFYRDLSVAIMDLDDRAISLLLEKGLYVRAPYISTDRRPELADSLGFLGSFFGAGVRKLLALEVGTLFSNIQNNVVGKMLLTGFSQAAESPDIRKYMNRGTEVANKHEQILSQMLRAEDIPVPMTADSGVTMSTVAPFSDRLMLYHVALLNQVGFGAYATSLATAMRKDLQACYTRLMAEIGEYSADGARLFIDHGWLEAPPGVADHREVALHQFH